jgi:hypothetical protein
VSEVTQDLLVQSTIHRGGGDDPTCVEDELTNSKEGKLGTVSAVGIGVRNSR